jgi:hypothetical protein
LLFSPVRENPIACSLKNREVEQAARELDGVQRDKLGGERFRIKTACLICSTKHLNGEGRYLHHPGEGVQDELTQFQVVPFSLIQDVPNILTIRLTNNQDGLI